MDASDLARAYYRAIDDGDYDALADVLASGFVHERPDRTIEGREMIENSLSACRDANALKLTLASC